MEKILCDKLRFVDESGRTRILNGMNIDDKLTDQEAFRYELDEEFFRKYRAFGLDIIRLAVTWQNIEPAMGEYNESYLKSIDDIFDLAEKYGVYILLDMHQDLYSNFDAQSVGDGAPSWAAITDGAKPKMPKSVWAEGYFWGKWVHRAFDHFWANTPVNGKGIQDRYAEMWQMLAERYGDKPALFGFDLMNEPFPGSDATGMFLRLVLSIARAVLFSKKIKTGRLVGAFLKHDDKTMLDSIPGNVIRDVMKRVDKAEAKFDINKYSPFVNKISTAIREKTKNGIIMMEQSYICNTGVKQSAPPITVNSQKEPQQCFGPHAYDMTVDTPLYQYANADRVKAFFTEMRNTQLRLEVPCIVGEWGGCSDNTDTSWFPHAYELLDFFDEMQWGQMYWDYHGDDMDAPLMTMLSRTCPKAVAGEIKSYGYDRENKVFTLNYTSDGKGETVIYVHKPFTADCEYNTIEQYENGASLISIPARAGDNTIRLTIND